MTAPRPRAIIGDESALRRDSDGREPRAFRARRVEELLGAHAELVSSALRGASPEFLAYLPMWEGSRAPFGIVAPPASHGLAVAADRLVISGDRHRADDAATVVSVPFANLRTLVWGSSLMVGWLRLAWRAGAASRSLALLYRASTGHRHVLELVRQARSRFPRADLGTLAGPRWEAVWHASGRLLRDEIEPVLLPGESVLAVADSSVAERTHSRRGRKTPDEMPLLVVLTDRGVLAGRVIPDGLAADVAFMPHANATVIEPSSPRGSLRRDPCR